MTDCTRSSKTELLPCPFCGAQPVWDQENGFLGCMDKDCAAPYAIGGTLEEASAIWNKRRADEPSGLLADVLAKWREYAKDRRDGMRLPLRSGEYELVDDILQDIRRATVPPSAPLTPHGQALLDEAASLIRQIGRELDWGPGVKGETWRRINAFIQATPVPPETKPALTDHEGRPMTYWGGKADETSGALLSPGYCECGHARGVHKNLSEDCSLCECYRYVVPLSEGASND